MKRLLLVIIAMMSLLPAFAGEKAKMTLVTKVHDFGYVKEKGRNSGMAKTGFI